MYVYVHKLFIDVHQAVVTTKSGLSYIVVVVQLELCGIFIE